MQYKALFSDVDGTLVPYNYMALPSDTVVEAVKKAQEKVIVCLVTARSYGFIEQILSKLELHTGYAVVNTSAHIIDLSDGKVIHDQPIEHDDALEMINILNKENIDFYLKQDAHELSYQKGYFKDVSSLKYAYMVFTDEIYSSEKVDDVLRKLSHLPLLNAHKSHHKNPHKFGINIGHINATKLHGVEFLLKKLNISKDEVIGVGDSYNDFPLLMASGLKVAMGNAIDDLKAIADYVAPSVTHDGVADVIEKFILKNK